jgi:hypothetical protein
VSNAVFATKLAFLLGIEVGLLISAIIVAAVGMAFLWKDGR